ncbi:MAG TPA: aldolase/citrate lyase family protein [Chloroflexota bacterium]
MLQKNTLKEKLKAGTPCLGVFINFPSPQAVEICGLCGLDFVIVDAEHGPMSIESAESMVRAAQLTGMTPIVRVAQNLPQVILRYLDIGSGGVQLPMINTAKDAEAAVMAVKYHPEGRRGLAGTRAASYGLGRPLSEYVLEANRETLLVTHVETLAAVDALPQVLKLDAVDVVFIGPTDLSQSMGFPGRPNEPAVQEVIDRCIAQIRAGGKAVGTACRDGEQARQLIDKGVTYLAASVGGLLGGALKSYVGAVRGE